MIGNECPECGKRLEGHRCRCGWQANMPTEDKTPAWQKCHRCGDASKNTTFFHDDGAPEDRGLRLCPGCWIPALKRRAERDPISAADRLRLRQALYAHLDRLNERVLTTRTRDAEATRL